MGRRVTAKSTLVLLSLGISVSLVACAGSTPPTTIPLEPTPDATPTPVSTSTPPPTPEPTRTPVATPTIKATATQPRASITCALGSRKPRGSVAASVMPFYS